MTTSTTSSTFGLRSQDSGIGAFDADEIRNMIRRGKARGDVRGPGEALAIKKDGKPVAYQGGLKTYWIDVTPPLAKLWLENNFRNRPIDWGVVDAYARDMANGVWVPTHQGIGFSDADELIDGQQRLHSIIKANVTIRMMVTFGLPSKIEGHEMTPMDAVDRGRTRSVADQLKIQHGIKDASITAAICASLGTICCTKRTKRLSVGETLEIYRAFEDAVQWVIIHRSKLPGFRSAGFLAAFAFALITEDGFFGGATPIAVMYDRLLSGKDLPAKSPIKHLHSFLTSEDARLLCRGTDRGLAELVLNALHLESKGRSISVLKMSTEGASYFRGLQQKRVDKISAIFALTCEKEAPAKAA